MASPPRPLCPATPPPAIAHLRAASPSPPPRTPPRTRPLPAPRPPPPVRDAPPLPDAPPTPHRPRHVLRALPLDQPHRPHRPRDRHHGIRQPPHNPSLQRRSRLLLHCVQRHHRE